MSAWNLMNHWNVTCSLTLTNILCSSAKHTWVLSSQNLSFIVIIDYFPLKLSYIAHEFVLISFEVKKKSKHVFLIFLKVCIKDDNVMCPNLQTSASPRSPLRPSIAPLPGCQWEAPGEAAWNSRLLVGKWHLQLNAARLPCQCVLVK